MMIAAAFFVAGATIGRPQTHSAAKRASDARPYNKYSNYNLSGCTIVNETCVIHCNDDTVRFIVRTN